MIFYRLRIELFFDPCRILSDSTGIYPEHTGILNVQCNFFSLLLFQTQSYSVGIFPQDAHQIRRHNSIFKQM